MILRILFSILVLAPSFLSGQVLSNKGRFSVEFDRGCVPMVVNVTELDSFGDITRQYFYEEGSDITNSKTHTYSSSNTYDIIQVIGVDNQGSKFDTLRVEVFDSFKPEINMEKCGGNEISVTSEESTYDFIRIYYNSDDSIQLLQNETATLTFPSNDEQSIAFKGFFEDADNKCSNYFERVSPISSIPAPILSSVSIKESCKDAFTLYLALASFDTLITYQVLLTQTATNVVFENKITSNQLILPNIPFSKSEGNYCLQVKAIDPCNKTSIDGNEICQQSSNLSLSPFESLYSSYIGNSIKINLDSVATGSFHVFRRREEEIFQKEDSVISTYIDKIGTNRRKYFYKIDYMDSCDQILFSAETSPPFIDSFQTDKNSYSIDFTFSEPLDNGTYILESIVGNDESQSTERYNIVKSEVSKTFNFDLNLNAKDGTSSQIVTTNLYSTSGELLRRSNSINLKFEIEIYVPTAFTPNNDGLNDTLELFGLPTNSAEIKIYSQWGHLIYSSDTPTPGWDGTIDGKIAPEGTYLYEIIFESTQGEKLRQKGTFALITK